MNQNQTPQKPKIEFDQLSPNGKLELSLLTAIQAFFSRIKDIAAKEARTFVQCEEYLKAKVEELIQRETFMFEAKQRANVVVEKLDSVVPKPTNVVDIKKKEDTKPPKDDGDGADLGRS